MEEFELIRIKIDRLFYDDAIENLAKFGWTKTADCTKTTSYDEIYVNPLHRSYGKKSDDVVIVAFKRDTKSPEYPVQRKLWKEYVEALHSVRITIYNPGNPWKAIIPGIALTGQGVSFVAASLFTYGEEYAEYSHDGALDILGGVVIGFVIFGIIMAIVGGIILACGINKRKEIISVNASRQAKLKKDKQEQIRKLKEILREIDAFAQPKELTENN